MRDRQIDRQTDIVLLYLEMMVIGVVSFSGLFVIQAVHSQYTEPESVALH